jgi:hypothetical protein
MEARHARTLANAQRTRELAERAFAKLDDGGRFRVHELTHGRHG